MKKSIFIVGSYILLLAIIFWICFIVIASRNPSYEYIVKKDCKKVQDELYFTKNGINYYGNCLVDVEIIEKRFIFKFNKGSLKNYIKNGKLNKLKKGLNTYKYNYGDRLETKYYNDVRDFVITRCSYEEGDYYYIDNNYDQTTCEHTYKK